MGHVNVRWTLYMMFLLRDDPSLELVHVVGMGVGWGGVGWGGAC